MSISRDVVVALHINRQADTRSLAQTSSRWIEAEYFDSELTASVQSGGVTAPPSEARRLSPRVTNSVCQRVGRQPTFPIASREIARQIAPISKRTVIGGRALSRNLRVG